MGEIDANPKYGEIEEILDTVEKRFNRLKNFDIIKGNPPSHLLLYYYSSYFNEYGSKIKNRRMGKEHKLLEEKLPASIFVRAYETQVDVLRAAIIGPPNTPYAHGLFFFDIVVPKAYPSCPPKLYYTSSSYDSLFSKESSKVNFKIVESWDPKTTILDVLLIIQQSLSEHIPLSIEHPSSWFSNHNQRDKDKMVWLSTCQGMMLTLQKPPQVFEDLVRGHFRKTAHPILMLFRDSSFKDDNDDERVIGIFSKLLEAFKANGTYCDHHIGQLGQMTEGE